MYTFSIPEAVPVGIPPAKTTPCPATAVIVAVPAGACPKSAHAPSPTTTTMIVAAAAQGSLLVIFFSITEENTTDKNLFENSGYGTATGWVRVNAVWDNNGNGYTLSAGGSITLDPIKLWGWK
ncbi:hypothetical protein ES703_114044 [subsurface metagenome]